MVSPFRTLSRISESLEIVQNEETLPAWAISFPFSNTNPAIRKRRFFRASRRYALLPPLRFAHTLSQDRITTTRRFAQSLFASRMISFASKRNKLPAICQYLCIYHDIMPCPCRKKITWDARIPFISLKYRDEVTLFISLSLRSVRLLAPVFPGNELAQKRLRNHWIQR